MSWAIGYDENWKRDIGYGVPAYCDHPGCMNEIDRGLAYVCCEQEPYGGEKGCGLYFCSDHSDIDGMCDRCARGNPASFDAKPDHPKWMRWKLRDSSWKHWRDESPAEVESIRTALRAIATSDKAHG